jgi:hypothetical protein
MMYGVSVQTSRCECARDCMEALEVRLYAWELSTIASIKCTMTSLHIDQQLRVRSFSDR